MWIDLLPGVVVAATTCLALVAIASPLRRRAQGRGSTLKGSRASRRAGR